MTQPIKVVEVQRLTEAVFNDFVSNLRGRHISVNDETSPLSAGYMLGVQHVINELRKGVVVS
jgi:hypothetical protein